MSLATEFIETLEAAANVAASVETAYRRESAARIKELERTRSFAFRRLSLLRPVVDAVARAESEEMAVGGGQAVLRVKLGWSSDNEARSLVLAHFASVVRGLYANVRPEAEMPSADVPALLAEFEIWHENTHQKSFWDLFDQPMPETPLVDF